MRAFFPVLFLVSVAAAGCLAGDGAGDDRPTDAHMAPITVARLAASTEDLSEAIDSDHGGAPALHAVPELHEGSHGLELVGYNSLTGTDGGPGFADSAPIAIDTHGDLLCVAHFAGSTGALGGATIVDISDPTDPTVLSRVLSGSVNSDCQFTDDGQYLVVAVYTGEEQPLSDFIAPPVGDAGANGMNLYDVSDPANPEFLFHDAQGAGGSGYHNVFTANIHGDNYIFQTYTGHILRILDDGSGLEMVSQLEYADHDLWVGQHPITGEWTVVTGAGYGTAVFNIDDPAAPELLSLWEGDRDDRYAGWHRQWPVDGTIDGKAYMVVAGEECGNGDSLPYQVLEWTDPSKLTMTGTWWIPGRPANPGTGADRDHLCEMNSHEFEVWDGYVATGNYHAGVWLFDVGSPERVVEPATIGYYLPSEVPQTGGGTVNAAFPWSPYVWGAYFDDDGYIYAADIHSGLYVLSFGATRTA